MNKTKIIYTLQIILISLILIGCNTKTYYAANNKNHQRLDGWQLETANHLVKINDLQLLIINLSELATESATSREIYLASKEIDERFNNLRLDTKMEAALQRATLSTALSAESDKFYHRLVNTTKEDFDDRYKSLVLDKLKELSQLIENYQENGHSDRIKTLNTKIQKVVSEHTEQLSGMKVI